MPYQTTTPAGAKELIEGSEDWIYLDVRSPEEFELGHAPGAFNIPFLFRTEMGMQPNPDFVAAVQRSFTTDSRLVLGCAAGGRSMHACELLSQEGYSHLANMYGGFTGAFDPGGNLVEAGWEACGFETTTDLNPERTWDALKG